MAEKHHIADEGTDCPAFIAEAAFDCEPQSSTHTVTIKDPSAHTKNGETRTDIQMIVNEDGGVVTYDNGVTIYRRLFNDSERAIKVFRDTVDVTLEDYRDRGVEFDFDYNAGREPVWFETQT